MNLICGECLKNKMYDYIEEVVKNRFNEAGRIKIDVGNLRKRFICFECGRIVERSAACAVIHAAGENISQYIIKND